MTIDELITLAEEAREDLGGGAQVRIAFQPGWPLRPALSCDIEDSATRVADLRRGICIVNLLPADSPVCPFR